MEISHKTKIFVILVFYKLDKRWKERFEDIYSGKRFASLPSVFEKLFKSNLYRKITDILSKNGMQNFHRYYTDEIIGFATSNELIRVDGGPHFLHLDILDNWSITTLSRENQIDLKEIEYVAKMISIQLDRQEKRLNRRSPIPS